jgi:ABC-type sugar transport system ATPase subunit
MSFLRVEGITRTENDHLALRGVSLQQQRLEKLAIAGETGCGKTSLLKIIAGLVQPDAGNVYIENERVEGPWEKLIPGHPGVAYLSQHFELPNYLTVAQVLEYANEMSNEEAAGLFEVCRITHLMRRRTDRLSGGEKQRIALARLLITRPRLLLLDEPYSNLDMIHKQVLKQTVQDIGDRLQLNCIVVSHDPLDTLAWADRILVMRDGNIVQEGTPQNIYRKPADEYVAGLFGKYNLVNPAMFGLPGNTTGKKLFLRPEDIHVTDEGAGYIVKDLFYAGNYTDVVVAGNEQSLLLRITGSQQLEKGALLTVSVNKGNEWYV